jgi:transglutaminase-like putative cysteine protease
LAVHRWVQNNIRYTRDPVGQETIQTPEHNAFVNQAGECDDFSILEAATPVYSGALFAGLT